MRLRTVSVPVVSGSDAQHMFRREFFEIFRSLDIVQESVRQQLRVHVCPCVPMRAKLESVRMGGVKRDSQRKLTERSEAHASVGVGLVAKPCFRMSQLLTTSQRLTTSQNVSTSDNVSECFRTSDNVSERLNV